MRSDQFSFGCQCHEHILGDLLRELTISSPSKGPRVYEPAEFLKELAKAHLVARFGEGL